MNSIYKLIYHINVTCFKLAPWVFAVLRSWGIFNFKYDWLIFMMLILFCGTTWFFTFDIGEDE